MDELLKSKTLAGSVTLFYNHPDIMIGKPALFDFFCKNMCFFYKHAIRRSSSGILRKEQVDQLLLARFGIELYNENPEHSSACLLKNCN